MITSAEDEFIVLGSNLHLELSRIFRFQRGIDPRKTSRAVDWLLRDFGPNAMQDREDIGATVVLLSRRWTFAWSSSDHRSMVFYFRFEPDLMNFVLRWGSK